MTDIVTFLTARLDEDEQLAREATPGPWTVDDETYAETIYGGSHNGNHTAVVAGSRWNGEASIFESTEDARHMARHDPARVLREVKAKRAILREHEPSKGPDPVCGHCVLHRTSGACKPAPYPCLTLRALAVPYDEHPDYDAAWRVE